MKRFFLFLLLLPLPVLGADDPIPHWRCGTYEVVGVFRAQSKGPVRLEFLVGSRSHSELELPDASVQDRISYAGLRVRAEIQIEQPGIAGSAKARLLKIKGNATQSAALSSFYKFLAAKDCRQK